MTTIVAPPWEEQPLQVELLMRRQTVKHTVEKTQRGQK